MDRTGRGGRLVTTRTGKPLASRVMVARAQRTLDHLSNGALVYLLFAGLTAGLAVKQDAVAFAIHEIAIDPDWLSWILVDAVVPFVAGAIGAALALIGLRVALRRLRLTLSSDEHGASLAFLAMVTLTALAGAIADLDSADQAMAVANVEPTTLPSIWISHIAVVIGAVCGVFLRRRIAL